ncbi:hypothetical protein WB44_07085 [Synechococcus sp. WH 8020]|nr:hypothetical protein WB44_07085 [Synechococcus sp. WH 8020]
MSCFDERSLFCIPFLSLLGVPFQAQNQSFDACPSQRGPQEFHILIQDLAGSLDEFEALNGGRRGILKQILLVRSCSSISMANSLYR